MSDCAVGRTGAAYRVGMSSPASPKSSRLSLAERRRSIAAAYLNAGLWGLGSGLASTTLVTYFARGLGASGQAIGWILAAPSLVGLLRLATPAWLARVRSRRAFCVALFLASAAALAALPLVAILGGRTSTRAPIGGIVVAWAGFHLFDYVAVIALWSWLRDLVPRQVRGRFLGRRESWLNGGAVVGSIIAIAVTMLGDLLAPQFGAGDIYGKSLAVCGLAGAASFAAAALVLLQAADLPHAEATRTRTMRLRDLAAPWVDARFRKFLAFGLWFSFSNGIVQTAQSLVFINPLDVKFGVKKSLDGALRAGKAIVTPQVGRAVDRRGNVPLLAASQALIALAPLWFLFATPAAPWWILGVYLLWLAYAGHDVALPNLMLGLSPAGETANFAAAWFAWTQLAFSLSVIAGGVVFDWLAANVPPLALGGRPVDHFAILFIAGWMLKSFGVILALRIPEPQISSTAE